MCVGTTMTYCAEAFDAAVTLPKCFAARTAEARILDSLGAATAFDALSYQTPASGDEVACFVWRPDPPHWVRPTAIEVPSQYWVVDVLQFSVPYMPRKNCCTRGAMWAGSPLKVRSAPIVVAVPHCRP